MGKIIACFNMYKAHTQIQPHTYTPKQGKPALLEHVHTGRPSQ